MRAPRLVRMLTDAERAAVQRGRRSSAASALRSSQIVAASAQRALPPDRAHPEWCRAGRPQGHPGLPPGRHGGADQAVLRAHTDHAAFPPAAAERLRALRHRRPREFGHQTSLWTLARAAAEAHRQGLPATRVTGETLRATLARLGAPPAHAQRWIT